MKALNRYTLIPFALAGFIATSALAANNAVVQVTATVTGTCQFNSGGSVTFTLDPSSSADATGSVTQPAFWCTNGTAYSITDDFGVNEAVANTVPRRLKDSGTNYIPYDLTYTATGTGAGKNSPISMNIGATVLNTNFVNAPVGSYNDTVTLTITP